MLTHPPTHISFHRNTPNDAILDLCLEECL